MKLRLKIGYSPLTIHSREMKFILIKHMYSIHTRELKLISVVALNYQAILVMYIT